MVVSNPEEGNLDQNMKKSGAGVSYAGVSPLQSPSNVKKKKKSVRMSIDFG